MIDTKKVTELNSRLTARLSGVVIGRDDLKQYLLIALLAGGHVLIEGLPGTGKTKLAKTFAELIGGKFKRIQCVPDMLPADITGFYMYSPDGSPRLIEGPIFANILVADELNRATPRTQAALLESMQECQVTIERNTFKLPAPFMVVATQQQTGAEGTYPVTNVQADRFLLRHLSGFASRREEAEIIANIDRIEEPVTEPVTTLEEIVAAQEMTKQVHVAAEIVDYITALTESLRADPDVALAPSTRAAITLFKCSRARALLDGRDFVIPDDIKRLFVAGVEHRLSVRPEAEMDEVTPRMILERTLDKVAVPK
jgi:MoxR-like ATPase